MRRRAGRRGGGGRLAARASACPSAGRYGRALERPGPAGDTRGRSAERSGCSPRWPAATVASVHRQLGRHAVAQGYDERALEGSDGEPVRPVSTPCSGWRPTRSGWATARRPLSRLAEAGQRWPTAAPTGGASGCGWAGSGAEVALLEDRAGGRRRGCAQAAVELAEHSGAPRHVAKGLLFLGVAQVEAGRPDEAAADAAPGRAAGREPGHAAAAVAGAGRARRPAGRDATRARAPGPWPPGAPSRPIADGPARGLRGGLAGRPDVAAVLRRAERGSGARTRGRAHGSGASDRADERPGAPGSAPADVCEVTVRL